METRAAEPQLPAASPPPLARFSFGLTANTLLGYTLVKGLQLTLYNLIFPLYLYSLGYDQEVIGRLNALGALTVLLGSVPIGMIGDRIGQARLLVIGAILSPLALAGGALASSIPALVAWLIAYNAAGLIYWLSLSPLLVGAVPPERRVRAFAANSFLFLGVGALGSALGGLIAAVVGRILAVSSHATVPLRAALLINALVMLLGALPLWRIRNLAASGDDAAPRAPLRLADLRLFGRLLLPDALQACAAGSVVGFLPLFFSLRFGLEPGALGGLFTATGVLSGVAALGAPVLVRRLGSVGAIAGLMCAVALCIGLTVLAPFAVAAILAETLRACLRGTIDPIYTPFAMSRVAPERRGTLAGFYNVTYAIGFSLGPLVSGWLQVHYGFGLAFGSGASASLLAAVVIWLFWRTANPAESRSASGENR